MLFTGRFQHEGANVTGGVRYLLAGFVTFVTPAASELQVLRRVPRAANRMVANRHYGARPLRITGGQRAARRQARAAAAGFALQRPATRAARRRALGPAARRDARDAKARAAAGAVDGGGAAAAALVPQLSPRGIGRGRRRGSRGAQGDERDDAARGARLPAPRRRLAARRPPERPARAKAARPDGGRAGGGGRCTCAPSQADRFVVAEVDVAHAHVHVVGTGKWQLAMRYIGCHDSRRSQSGRGIVQL
eukprot:4967169-Prymnesium_polylepis.1